MINNVVKNCDYHLQALRHIRPSITKEVANTIACAVIGSRLDYCNSMFYEMSDKNCSVFTIVQHELSAESVDGKKMLGSCVTTCTGYLFTLGRILNWQLCVLNHTSCDNRIIWQ